MHKQHFDATPQSSAIQDAIILDANIQYAVLKGYLGLAAAILICFLPSSMPQEFHQIVSRRPQGPSRAKRINV